MGKLLPVTHAKDKIITGEDALLLDDYQKRAGKPILARHTLTQAAAIIISWDMLYGSTKLNTYDNQKLPGNPEYGRLQRRWRYR